MNILALDTSTPLGSVALVSHGLVLAETTYRATHTEEILTVVHEVITRAKIPLRELNALAVGIGPGSFTGVRIAMATARGLQIATNLPLFGVSSLDALAASTWAAHGHVAALLDARRGEVFASVYTLHANHRERLLGPLCGPPESVSSRVLALLGQAPCLVVGDLSPALQTRFESGHPQQFTFAPSVASSPLARYLAHEVIHERALRDDGSMEPLYLRDIDAKLPALPQSAV